jgi:hypothetical protein
MSIDWKYPEPRKGFLGEWDKFIGPGASRTEISLILSAATLGATGMLLYSLLGNLGWNAVQSVIATLVAADLAGGVVANASSPTKRWYHREGQGFWNHMGFVAIHIYPFIVAWLFRPYHPNFDWLYAVIIYGYLIIASIILLLIPQYLQRPVAMILFCGAILLNWYAFSLTLGLEWFIPVLFAKLILGHLVKEEPYRADRD